MNIQLDDNADVQTNFDIMYGVMLDLLDKFYPEREITVTSTDPPYVTPTVKAMLRRKNRLMHAGRTDEAEAIAARIRTIITRSSSRWLRTVDTRKNPKYPKYAWAKVREIIKGSASRDSDQVDGLTAQSLSNHYAAISTDREYRAPRPKLTAFGDLCLITKATVFRMLDTRDTTRDSDRTRPDTGVVFASRRAHLRRTARSSV